MFASLLGIRLVLWVGATVPTPPSLDLLNALQRVEVTNDDQHGDAFELTFTLTKGLVDYNLLSGGELDQDNRVIIGVVMGASPEVLIDGIITQHHLSPSEDPGQSTLTVQGRDLREAMDRDQQSKSYENQPDFVIVTQLIASYAQYGLIPTVTPTTDVPLIIQRIPRQTETDLRFIQRMARRNGYRFYIEPVTFGVNNAYFGPPVRGGVPQPALSMNMGPDSNLTNLSFGYDARSTVGVKGSFVEPITKTSIPLPSLPSLRVPPLASSPAPAKRTRVLRDTARRDPAQAALAGLAETTNAPDAVKGYGTVDAVLYGSVLRARGLVGLRGAGRGYDGMYYVERVKHHIEQGSYTQELTLSREGTGTLLPVVLP